MENTLQLPIIVVSDDAKKYILKRSTCAILSRSPKAGRYGYPSDALIVKCEKPQNTGDYSLVHAEGINFYLDNRLTLENYEQLNVWIRKEWGLLKSLKSRITLYRRLDL